jgi:DNA-binding GntR family transcriptional regulator
MIKLDRPPTLVEVVTESLRKEILKGSFLPGAALPEVELSKNLNISRGTVRESLRQLDQEGLVEVIPHRGAFVAQLTPQKVKEIYTLRVLLEPYAVRLSMENQAFDEEYLDEMRDLVGLMGEFEKAGDYRRTIEADIRFHEMSSERCGHELLIDVLHNLQSLTLVFILTTKLYRSDMVSDEVSHQAIFDGILSGDPVLAEAIVRKHITDAGTSLMKRMEEVGDIYQAAFAEQHREDPFLKEES